ncbi:MAG TPA: WG repeat-containing protein, partial [Paenibacillus sp.]|nr:WG repeat-containing protein [Paenibacillus sp.]
LEIGDVPGAPEHAGTAELALWIHDTGEAYRVELLRWDRNRFVPATDAEPSYFGRVAAYYAGMTSRYPDYRFYWYYYADALARAGRYEEALAAVDRALSIDSPYPTRETLLSLRNRLSGGVASAAAGLRSPAGLLRAGALYPAAVKEVGGTKWGFVDERGAWRIPATFDYANDFEGGVAVVQADGKYGAIDASGRFAVPAEYEWIDAFAEGRAIAYDKQGPRVIDESGRVLTTKPYGYIAKYSESRALFSQQGEQGSLYGYLNREGAEAIPAAFLEAGDFAGGKAIVKIADNEYALIGLGGKRKATYRHSYVGAPGDGVLPFRKDEDGKYGYIEEAGNVAIEPRFTEARPFREGRAVVNVAPDFNNAYGLIDRSGNVVVEPKYNDIRQLGDGRVALGQAIDPSQPFIGSMYSIADANNGKLLTDFRFYDVSEYEDGLSSVYDASQTYFVGRDGKPAAGLPRFDGSGTLRLRGDIVQANVDQRLFYYDKRLGRVVWKPSATIPLTPPYAVKEMKYKPNRDYLVYYPQLTGMQDASTQEKVNRTLRQLSEVKDVPAGQLDYSYTGDFDIPFFRGSLLVLELNAYHYPWGAAHGMPSLVYPHLNVENGRFYALKDLFLPGSDYVKTLSDIVGEQIKTDPQYDYVFPDTYTGIKPDQPFYVTSDALHLYFQPYEIGPYAAGFPTFRIPFERIRSIIDANGEFWKSFH